MTINIKMVDETSIEQDPLQFLEDYTQCKICFKQLEKPVITPCSHTFCAPCLITSEFQKCIICDTEFVISECHPNMLRHKACGFLNHLRRQTNMELMMNRLGRSFNCTIRFEAASSAPPSPPAPAKVSLRFRDLSSDYSAAEIESFKKERLKCSGPTISKTAPTAAESPSTSRTRSRKPRETIKHSSAKKREKTPVQAAKGKATPKKQEKDKPKGAACVVEHENTISTTSIHVLPVTKTYTRCRGTTESVPFYKFEDDSNRMTILEWLNNKNNNFDRIITPDIAFEGDLNISSGMRSSSGNTKKSKANEEHLKKRSRSLEVDTRKSNFRLQRKAYSSVNVNEENIIIEQFCTEELDLKKDTCEDKTMQVSVRTRGHDTNGKCTAKEANSSAWSRLKTNAKISKKNVKKPKPLNSLVVKKKVTAQVDIHESKALKSQCITVEENDEKIETLRQTGTEKLAQKRKTPHIDNIVERPEVNNERDASLSEIQDKPTQNSRFAVIYQLLNKLEKRIKDFDETCRVKTISNGCAISGLNVLPFDANATNCYKTVSSLRSIIHDIQEDFEKTTNAEGKKGTLVHEIGIQTEDLISFKIIQYDDVKENENPKVTPTTTKTISPLRSTRSSTLDNLNFDMQDLVQKKITINESNLKTILNQHQPPKNNIEEIKIWNANQPVNNVLSDIPLSVTLNSTNNRKAKRLRSPEPPDAAIIDNALKSSKKHKFIRRENLSIHFETESPNFVDREREKQSFSDLNYDEYLEKLIGNINTSKQSTQKKKEEEQVQSQQQQQPQPQYKRARTQDIIAECEMMIAEATKNQQQRFKQHQDNNTIITPHVLQEFESNFALDVSQKPSNSPIQQNINITASLLNEFEQKFTAELSKPRNGNTFSESLFGTDIKIDGQIRDRRQECVDKISEDVNDSFDEEMAAIVPNQNTNVHILEDVIIKNGAHNDSDDDIFTDVVETTPQKKKFREDTQLNRSQTQLQLPPPNDSPDVITSLDPQPLPPPIEFQDHITNSTIIAIPSSLCSPRSLERNCSVSPIPAASHVNPIDVARTSKTNPLTIVQPKTPKTERMISTSTPKQRSILTYIRAAVAAVAAADLENLTTTTTTNTNNNKDVKPCIACTRLPKEQLFAITSLTSKKLATYSGAYTDNVTHMIVCVDENNRIKDYTMKFVSAIASGIWVVSFKWIEECLKQGRIVYEEPYEALDVSGVDGPRKSRLYRQIKPLLKGFKIHVAAPISSATQSDVERVVKLLGGDVVKNVDSLRNKEKKICIIITEARTTQDFELYETWLQLLKVITVDLEWLSKSVGQYECCSLRSFALCPEMTFADLEYPPELLVETPASLS